MVRTIGLGGQRVLRQPRVGLPIGLVRRPQQFGERLRPGDVLQGVHPVLVVHPVGLHLGDGFAAGGPLLSQEDGLGRVEDRLDDRDTTSSA
jgi:hypothetical protein